MRIPAVRIKGADCPLAVSLIGSRAIPRNLLFQTGHRERNPLLSGSSRAVAPPAMNFAAGLSVDEQQQLAGYISGLTALTSPGS
jgi:hypothetical protein